MAQWHANDGIATWTKKWPGAIASHWLTYKLCGKKKMYSQVASWWLSCNMDKRGGPSCELMVDLRMGLKKSAPSCDSMVDF